MFNLNQKEALKLMIDGKILISIHGEQFMIIENNIIVKGDSLLGCYSITDFLNDKDYNSILYKEYIEPKKPRNKGFKE